MKAVLDVVTLLLLLLATEAYDGLQITQSKAEQSFVLAPTEIISTRSPRVHSRLELRRRLYTITRGNATCALEFFHLR
jgi:hypothetical protein